MSAQEHSRHPRESTALYRLYNASGDLLYVGVSRHPEQRFTEHRTGPDRFRWIAEVAHQSTEWHPSRSEALAAEKSAIQAERPRYNGTYNYDEAPLPTSWKPVGDTGKSAAVAHLIRTEIEAARWKPKQRIPELRLLAAATGVSERTVGAAIKTLKAEGLLESRAGHGLFVAVDGSWTVPASKYANDGRLFHDWTYDHLD